MNRDGKLETELIATLLGDRRPSAALEAWLATEAGSRSAEEYRGALRALDRAYGACPPGETLWFTEVGTTPVGSIFLAAGSRGLVRVWFGGDEAAFRADLARRSGLPRALERDPGRLAAAAGQLAEYFAGRRRVFDLETDLGGLTPFQRRVLEATRAIPAGAFVSYGALARRIGAPGASRAVGQALGRNPIPIVIPCHRVLATGGGIGGYTGGLAIKRRLLTVEGVEAPVPGVESQAKFRFEPPEPRT
jgi:methylated-DNA-[protein]-cysteine S-methyltransferase